jgi:hypothetical protein
MVVHAQGSNIDRFQQRQASRDVGGQSQTRDDVRAMIGLGWASRLVKICRVPATVFQRACTPAPDSARQGQEEIWPL